MNIEEREPLLNLETKKKNKVNIRISNLALNQTSKDIEPIDTTTLNGLTYSTASNQPENVKSRKKNEEFRGEKPTRENVSKGINVKTRKGQKAKEIYKLENEMI